MKKNLIRAMAISGAFAGLAGAVDMLGYLYHMAARRPDSARSGFIGIAVALLGRNTAVGVFLGSLLFGGLIYGTTQGLSSNVIQPELAGNLTLIILGLVVLFVSADLLILYVWNARKRLRPPDGAAASPAKAAAERLGAGLENPVSDRLRDPAATGYVGLGLGAFAAFLAIPPIEARSPTGR